jgi:hypothetical protein
MTRPTCSACRFWQPHGKRPVSGECRCNPPSLHGEDGTWPITDGATGWCGSHETHEDAAACAETLKRIRARDAEIAERLERAGGMLG